MKILEITNNKRKYLDLLLIGDEDENMIYKYLEQSTLFVLSDNDTVKSAAAVVIIDSDTIEIKNLATYPQFRNKGHATSLLDFICKKYKNNVRYIILGTGENPKTLEYYKKRGFVEFNKIKNFFTDNYSHPIFENDIQLVDMIYLKKPL